MASATAVPVVTPPDPAPPITMGVPTATLMLAGPQTVAVMGIIRSPRPIWLLPLEQPHLGGGAGGKQQIPPPPLIGRAEAVAALSVRVSTPVVPVAVTDANVASRLPLKVSRIWAAAVAPVRE
jgi:hypothetical protein